VFNLWVKVQILCILLLTLDFWQLNQPAQASEQIGAWVRSLVQEAYPELNAESLTISTFSEPDSYFQSNFEPLSLLNAHPVYKIQYNPLIWQKQCPPEAIKGILAHELAHTLDYHQGKIPGLFLLLNQIRLYPGLRRYERRTDLQAIYRGYGQGLKRYRDWIYAQLSLEERIRKQEIYFTPTEITLIENAFKLAEKSNQREALFQYWYAQTPLNQSEIQAGLRHFKLEADLGIRADAHSPHN